ncbi:DUF202-containing protein [Aureococcus anophagefferens]|nr:DUF202-containing protein [Aureococcus anophagefferens]
MAETALDHGRRCITVVKAGDAASEKVYATETSSGCIVCVNEYLPSGSELAVTVVRALTPSSRARAPAAGTPVAGEHEPLLTGALSLPAARARPTEASFRAQLLKPSASTHLANERTWLAWMRTALSLVSCAFTILDYADDQSGGWYATYFVVGCLFVGCVDLTWLTGYMRYKRTKEILAIPKDALPRSSPGSAAKYQARPASSSSRPWSFSSGLARDLTKTGRASSVPLEEPRTFAARRRPPDARAEALEPAALSPASSSASQCDTSMGRLCFFA